MAVVNPWAIQALSHPASAVRQSLQGLLGSPIAAFAGGIGSTAAGGGHGVIGAGDLAVSQHGTPNMSVDVAAGACAIRGTENQFQGCYGPCINDALFNVVISAADPTNARKDLIVAKIRDAQYSGGANDFLIVVVTGTPAGSPADPAVPANALVLARVNVAAAAASITNANITDLRPRAYALGGIDPTASSTFYPSAPTEGQYLDDAALDALLRYSGSAWGRPKNLAGGVLAYGQRTSDAGPDAFATVDLDTTNLQKTATVEANRYIRITGYFKELVGSVTADVFQLLIREGGTTLQRQDFRVDNSALGNPGGIVQVVLVAPSAGAHTYKLTGVRAAGTGTGTFKGAADSPIWMLVEDIGGV